MSKRNQPTLLFSHKSRRIYIVTKYHRNRETGEVLAFDKVDATKDFAVIVDALKLPKETRDQVIAALGLARADQAQQDAAAAVEAVPLEDE